MTRIPRKTKYARRNTKKENKILYELYGPIVFEDPIAPTLWQRAKAWFNVVIGGRREEL